MSIQRESSFDIQSPDICELLKSYDYDELNNYESIRTDRRADSYEGTVKPGSFQVCENFEIPLFIKRQCTLISKHGRMTQNIEVTDCLPVPMTLSFSHCLFLKSGLPQTSIDEVSKAFDAILVGDADPNIIELDLYESGVAPSDYQIDIVYKIEKVPLPRSLPRENWDNFLTQLKYYPDPADPYYRTESGKEFLSCEGESVNYPDEHVVVGDPDNPEGSILPDLQERNARCEDLVLTAHRVGTAWQIPEYKILWIMRRIRIGKWKFGKTRMPEWKRRTTKYALWAFVGSTKNVRDVAEKTIKRCIKQAALETGVLVIVTGLSALPVAVTIFVKRLWELLEEAFERNVDCLFPDLKIVIEKGEWH